MDLESSSHTSVTHGVSHSHTKGWSVSETDYMTGTYDHVCTAACCHIHLSARVQEFEKHLQQLAMALPVRDMIWYRDAIAATFTAILGGTSNAHNNRLT